jgi:hypothetical protein
MKLFLRALRALLAPALLMASGWANAEPAAMVEVPPGQALVVLHTRVDAAKTIPEGRLHFRPYDRASGRLGVKGFDTQGHHFTAGRWIGFISNKPHRDWKGWAIVVEPGSYVLSHSENPNLASTGGSMFSYTWAFDVAPDTVTYVGDFTQKWTSVSRSFALDVVPEFDEARARAFARASSQTSAPFVTAPLRPVELWRAADRSWMVRDSR